MKPYNEKAKCIKCGFGMISSRHRAKGDRDYNQYHGWYDDAFYEQECIERKCERCLYIWYEKPLNLKEE